ncbi:LuxR C-terminal-related transcriptional regulator [Pelotomaculum propionicicum]|uniref:LuxR C-terminal-related transcriptional regulator n=1 Tax=Pelotomaculum propionicicum TaxID=258475 RepID=UPI003B780D00
MKKTKQYNIKTLYFSDRIREAMDRVFDHPLTIIEAPMGYGKTTAVKGLLNNAGVNVLWQTVYDGYASSFWSGFSKLFAELDECALRLARLGLPNDSVSRQEALNLIEEVRLPEKTVIIIDDYYLIDNTDIDNFIVFLVKNEIKNLHVIITTRLALFENLDELKLKGYAYHITKETLELTPNEITRYYRLCGISLKADEVNKLYTYTEGWISALYLFMLNMLSDGGIKQESAESRVPLMPSIYNLVEKAVFNPLSEEIKEFMLSVCIYDNFTVEQAEHIWQKQNAPELLAEILSRNVFVSYDIQIKTYRIHRILTTFLRDILGRKELRYKQELHQKAAQWYMKTGNYLTAMHHYYLCQDFDKLLDAVEIDKGNSIYFEQKDLFIKYFEECPKKHKHNHPVALLIYAMCMLTFNEMELLAEACSEFICHLESPDLDHDSRNQLIGEYELLQSFTKYNDIMEMSQHHRKACELVRTSAVFLDTKGPWTMGSPSVLYMFHREAGKLANEVSDLKDSMPYYYQLTRGHGNGAEYVMAAEWHFNLGDFEKAEIAVHKALYLANIQPEIVICAMFLQIRIALMKADFPNVLYLLERMKEGINQKKLYSLIHTLDMCEGFIYACLKQGGRIPAWIVNGDFNSSRLLFPTTAFYNIIYGRTLLIKGDYLKMIGIAEQFKVIAAVSPNLLADIYTCIYVAAANERIYQWDDALGTLKQALDIAVPDRVYMPFVENYDYVKPLLEQIHREGNYGDHIARIFKLGATYQNATTQIIRDYFTLIKPKLTERELEIALLVVDGLTNKEIGKRLYISENTVKTQLKSIFDKLGVNSRSLLKQYLQKENE